MVSYVYAEVVRGCEEYMKKQPFVNDEIEAMYREDGLVHCVICQTADDLIVDEDDNDMCTDCLFEKQSESL